MNILSTIQKDHKDNHLQSRKHSKQIILIWEHYLTEWGSLQSSRTEAKCKDINPR